MIKIRKNKTFAQIEITLTYIKDKNDVKYKNNYQ